MDKSREEFEKNWIARGGDSSDLARYPDGHYEPGSGSVGGTYMLDDLHGHWETWQASRKALVVTLPQGTGWNSDPYNSGRNAGLQQAANAIRTAGITVKGEGDG